MQLIGYSAAFLWKATILQAFRFPRRFHPDALVELCSWARAFGFAMKVTLLIDGGYLRAAAQRAKKKYDVAFISSFSHTCVERDEYLVRVLYYDAPRYHGDVDLPVSQGKKQFRANNDWLDELARLERFAVRRGTLGFRGWKPKDIPVMARPLTDDDFSPVFEQKGVDVRIGLDIAVICEKKSVDRVILISGDTDMIPAMKHARKAGVEVGVIQLAEPTSPLHGALRAHSDFCRRVDWD